jgi:flagellum-specific ATP synthase
MRDSLSNTALTRLRELDTMRYVGRIERVVGMLVEAVLPNARIGALCRIETPGSRPILAEVVGLKEGRVVMMPLGERTGLTIGTPVTMSANDARLRVGAGCLGRVLNGLGRPIDGKGPLEDVDEVPLTPRPINPLDRGVISRPIDMGVRAINGLITVGEGQRLAILAGAGVGKSTLLAMAARNTEADVTVIGLIGERGREVQEFVERDLRLQESGGERICVVAATSDESPALRIRAAFTATAIAEYFRAQGLRVLLLMDSLTRVVMAQREIGLSVGEPPATRGYPPSAFQMIPRLLERAGLGRRGSITALYTTLVEADDPDDPVADAVRGTTDGHIVLSRKLAEAGHYPAIDVPRSISRVMRNIVEPNHLDAATSFRKLLVDYEAAQELITLGAYRQGSNREQDAAIERYPELREFLVQSPDENVSLDASIGALKPFKPTPRQAPSTPPGFGDRPSSGRFVREASRTYKSVGKQTGGQS